jgi:hypothetical protein
MVEAGAGADIEEPRDSVMLGDMSSGLGDGRRRGAHCGGCGRRRLARLRQPRNGRWLKEDSCSVESLGIRGWRQGRLEAEERRRQQEQSEKWSGSQMEWEHDEEKNKGNFASALRSSRG